MFTRKIFLNKKSLYPIDTPCWDTSRNLTRWQCLYKKYELLVFRIIFKQPMQVQTPIHNLNGVWFWHPLKLNKTKAHCYENYEHVIKNNNFHLM
jgi:hypothetical protein